MAIFSNFSRKSRRERRPAWDQNSISETSDSRNDNTDHFLRNEETTTTRKRPLQLGTLRYVNYNSRTKSCSLERVLDAALETGKPIFAHFVASDPSADGETVARMFSNSCRNRVIEECFVPAVFNIEECNDASHMKLIRKWFGGPVGPSTNDRLRIVTHDGKRVIMESDDMLTDEIILEGIMMHALEELHRHVPECLYKHVRKGNGRSNATL